VEASHYKREEKTNQKTKHTGGGSIRKPGGSLGKKNANGLGQNGNPNRNENEVRGNPGKRPAGAHRNSGGAQKEETRFEAWWRLGHAGRSVGRVGFEGRGTHR